MTLPIYAINLDRSRERWQSLSDSAARQGLVLTRLSAVDGRSVPANERIEVSEEGFRRLSGRVMRRGGYGC